MHRKFKSKESAGNNGEPRNFLHPNDLLPGIEEFLCSVLAKESLTAEAEEQRQYFVERLDIIKLPPSVPPRPQSLGLKLYPVTNGSLPNQSSSTDSIPEQEDFAAYQRELSRALVAKGNTSTGSDEEEVKVYDDIEPKDDSVNNGSHIQPEDEESMYEIPQIKRNLSDSGYEKAVDTATLSKNGDSPATSESMSTTPAVGQPPPLPPRRERTASDAASRSSIASMLDEKFKENGLKLEQQNSTSSAGEKQFDSKSEKSSDDLLEEFTGDEIDAVSVDSLDQEGGGVKLPRVMKKKKHHRRVTQTLSAPLCDISNTFYDLDDILLSGELYYKSTLLSTKNMVALTHNNLVCYKHDKIDSKPILVIPLTGYRATFHKRHSRLSYEIQLCHNELEDHSFLTVFKEWAQTWCEYINCVSDGRKVQGPHYNLVRNRSLEPAFGSMYDLAKSDSKMYGSSVSVSSYDGLSTVSGSGKMKKRSNSGSRPRIGSIVSRASQFFDTLKLMKRSSNSGLAGTEQNIIPEDSKSSVKDDGGDKVKEKTFSFSGDSVSDQDSTYEPQTPLTPQSGVLEPTVIETPVDVPKTIKHQGYLNIYSSFNKRKWGKRWCKVLENNFECYRNQTSTICELDFILRGCILRRAIEETKSQLGLMLMENNREKITVEPLSWSELGSWLRVLMRETSTPKPPQGLEGYMEEAHQYSDIVDDTRLMDQTSSIDKQIPAENKNDRTLTSLDINHKMKETGSRHNTNRDSGNCSAESMDGKSDSLETTRHPEFTDSSLPRVNPHKTGDVYTIVRKTSTLNKPENQKKKARNQSKCMDPANKNNIPPNQVPSSDDNHSLDFGSTEDHLNELELEQSMMDEVLSRFTSHISGGFVIDIDGSENPATVLSSSLSSHNELEPAGLDKNSSVSVEKRRISRDLNELDVISPIKETSQIEQSEISSHKNFLCSSFVDESQHNDGLLSKSDGSNSDGAVINPANSNSISFPELSAAAVTRPDHQRQEINKTGDGEQETIKDKSKPVTSESYEICVETLADVLSNLSLEDKSTNGSESKGKDEGVGIDVNPEDSCDIKMQEPFDLNQKHILDDDARTRRSVVIREMAETGGDIVRTLQELRTKLVELKKDRINIHDRMQKMSSDRDRVYLEDEYNRLNRECDKVNEEIACLEELQKDQKSRKGSIFDDDLEEIDV